MIYTKEVAMLMSSQITAVLICCLLMHFATSGCSGVDGSSESEGLFHKALVGTWEVVKVDEEVICALSDYESGSCILQNQAAFLRTSITVSSFKMTKYDTDGEPISKYSGQCPIHEWTTNTFDVRGSSDDPNYGFCYVHNGVWHFHVEGTTAQIVDPIGYSMTWRR